MMKEIKELFKITGFSDIINKLYAKNKLSDKEAEYILGCAILLLDKYNQNDNRELFELAYNIVLRYSINSGDYNPLYYASCNYGFYPTVRFINSKNLLNKINISDAINDYKLEKYRNETYIETFEQYKAREEIVNSEKKNISFIAPTSSGKSSIIIQHLKRHTDLKKALIIVPTKSLITQTYIELRKSIRDRKIINHDSMYKNEDIFVGVVTQERAARMLENSNVSIDVIYVDEAHNIFSNDPRNILLSRVIKLCKVRNQNLQTIYLSPFVTDSQNLLQDNESIIDEQRICFNIKEPDIYEFRKDGAVVSYDRFSNRFYDIGECADWCKYIKENAKKKNFFFVNSPKKIEELAKELYQNTDKITDISKITELQNVIRKSVHPDFRIIKYLEHGIVYLHAQMPDQIKEYLEYQFKINDSIKYMIANSVILEGINLPIDTLFIFDVWNMNNSKLLNLFGRVNRLNNVFDIENGNLNMLLPEIHFINSKFWRYEMKNKILKLYCGQNDEVLNPTLCNCSLEGLSNNKREKEKKKNEEILEQEKLYFTEPKDDVDKLRRDLIVSGMNQLIAVNRNNVKIIMERLAKIDSSRPLINIVSDVFTHGVEVIDSAFSRLKNDAAVKYYTYFIKASKTENLTTLLNSQLEFYKSRKQERNYYMYVGKTYGECIGPYLEDAQRGKVYIDLREKSQEELINLLIVKTKVEQDFIGFQYNRAVDFLHDNHYIDDEKYNIEIYGTTDEIKIRLLNLGIPINLLNILSDNEQIQNVYVNGYGNLMGNRQLERFYNEQDDYTKYEMAKYIYFE